MKNYYHPWLVIGLSLLFCSNLSSQITFQKTFGGALDDVANWVANTSTGYIVAGYTSTASGGKDGYLLNLDFSGNVIWQKRIGGTGSDQFNVVYETTGGFMVLGETDSYGAGGKDSWLLKISPAGTILWSKTIGVPDYDDLATSMIPVSGNRILISATSTPAGTTDSHSCLYLVDNNGQTIWSNTYSVGQDLNLFRSNYVDNGVIYASGSEFEGEYDGLFIKIDLETGNVISTTRYQGNYNESLYYQQPASDGNIMLCDGTWSATDGASLKQWVNKVTPEGQTIWSKVYSRPTGGSLRGRIESAGEGNFLLTPYDPLFTPNGDAILTKIDNDGNVMWSRNYGRPGLDWLWKSQLTADGGFVSVGSTMGANGNRDVLIIKTDYDGLVEGCCIPKGGIIAENFDHPDYPVAYTYSNWVSTEPVLNQQVNANLQDHPYCANQPVQIVHDIELCPTGVFTFHGVDYYAPDEIIDVLPGLFGCDTTVHYNLQLLPQITRTENITFCPGDAVTIHGQNYYEPDTVVVNVSASNGCDTVVTYYLNYNTTPGSCLSCKGTFLKIVGGEGQSVQGFGVYDAGDGNFYVTGAKQDSALLIKMTPSGGILWSRTFDIIPGTNDNIAEIIVDSDGMIAGCGQSGDVQPIQAGFVFRYNPATNAMLWTRIVTTGSGFVMGIVEKAPGGNYILNSNPHEPTNNAQFTEISRATGAVVPGPFTKTMDVGSADNYNSIMVYNGKLYGVGRFTAGNQLTDMRHTISRYDLATGVMEFTQISHFWAGPPARLYGMDFVIHGDQFVSVGYGDETGDDLNNSKIFLHSDFLQLTQLGPLSRIDLLATTSEAVDEIVRVPDGYVLLCHSQFSAPADLFLVKVNEIHQVLWAKKVDYGIDQLLPISIVQSQLLAKDGFLYCVATTTNATGEKRMMILKISQDGKMDGNCGYVSDTPVTSELISFSTGQGLTPVETPVTDTFDPLTVSVANSKPASQFFCRELIEDFVQITLCHGESVTLGGQVYSTSDTVVLSFSNPNTCDSTITYFINVLPQPTVVFNDLGLCPNQPFTFHGIDYYAPGEVTDTLSNVNGCDSIVHYGLLLLPQPTRAQTISFCPGESVVIGGQVYTDSGIVTETIPGTVGCDTIVTYTLIKLPQPTVVFNDLGLCPQEAFTFHGIDYYAPGEITDTLSSVNGCDSIVHYGLLLLPQPVRAQTISFCPGESVVIGGQTYTNSGTVIDTIPGTVGCDTIVTYTLVKLPQPTRAKTISFCPGESIIIGGHAYTQPGTVIDTIPGTTGCDTIVTYTLHSLLPAPSVMSIHCPNDISLIADPGTAPLVVNYNLPTATSDCPCPGVALTLTAGLPSGGAFPNGITQVCYTAKDSCGHSASCCFKVTVREIQPCDVKVNGCMRYELLSVTADPVHNLTYRIKVTNNCANKLIYTAIQLPFGVTAMEPNDQTVFAAESGRKYDVRNPNYSPFYSIRFKSLADSISGGQSDIFEYTLPAQSAPNYIDITSRLVTQVYYEAHLNTFYCPIGVTPPNHRTELPESKPELQFSLFPNPSDGTLWVNIANWTGQNLPWRIFNSQGQQLMMRSADASEELFYIELPETMPNGLYFFEIQGADGRQATARFVLQR